MRKSFLTIFLLFLFVAFFAGCATHSVDQVLDPPGFLHGLFHGFVIFFSFIGSLFMDVEVYAFPNSGGWYDFGFLLGVMFFFGGGGAGSRGRKK